MELSFQKLETNSQFLTLKQLKLDTGEITAATLRTKLESQNTALIFLLTVNSKSFLIKFPIFFHFSTNFAIWRTSVLPSIIPFSFGEDEVNFDESVTATCTINKGDLPIHIWWSLTDSGLHEDRNLTSNDGVVITRNSQKLSVLNIDAVKARHRGNYTCFAQNRGGITQHSAFLYVNGD